MATVKVMSFNLRFPNKKDGNNCFDLRVPKIVETIRREAPDLIGFQEATLHSMDELSESLPEYLFLGHGREANYHGEGTIIAYRRGDLLLHSFREEWFSLTPDLPASRFSGLDQSACPRVLTTAEFVSRESGKPFRFFNIHTDHTGLQARYLECEILCRKIGESPLPFIVVGDFNAKPDSGEMCFVKKSIERFGGVEATEQIAATFHAFQGTPSCKIDYIFTSLKTDPGNAYAVPDDDSCGCYYSDHLALCALVEA